MIGFGRNHFELFDLPARYVVDADALDRAYRALQQSVHPDRHAAGDDTARRLAMQASARVNEAYRTLGDPVERARYLLALQGTDPLAGSNTALDVDFLERQLDRRERASEAAAARDAAALERVIDETRAEAASAEARLGALLDTGGPLAQACGQVRELAFLDKVVRDLDHLLVEVEV